MSMETSGKNNIKQASFILFYCQTNYLIIFL